MYILIDTNILVYFLSDPDYEKDFEQLKYLVENKSVWLLVPQTLRQEWDREKVKTLISLEKIFLEANKHSPTAGRAKDTDKFIKLKRKKIKEIDFWLDNGIKISLIDNVRLSCLDRSDAGLRPFPSARSTKGMADCYIYYSAIRFLRDNNIKRFIFISNNSSDFGLGTLFPDLSVEGIEALYYNNPGRCFHELKDQLGLRDRSNATDQSNQYILNVVDPQDDLLVYLHAALTEAKRELEFIPTDIFIRIAPLRISNVRHPYTYYNNFTLHTNNEKLLELFREVDYSELGRFKDGSRHENSPENLERLLEVLIRFRNNLVFFIAGVDRPGKLDIRTHKAKPCDCLHCQFLQLRIDECIQWFVENPDAEKGTIKEAITASQLGLSSRALKIYNALYDQAVQQNQVLNSLQYLLYSKWAAQHAEFTSAENVDDILKKIKPLNADDLFFDLQSEKPLDRELGFVLHRGDIMRRYAIEVGENSEKIRKHYDQQTKGGTSTADNYVPLIAAFLEIDSFIVQNGMPVTNFSDFEQISDRYIESLFMLKGLNQYQPGALECFNDLIISHLLFFGKWESMINYYYRFVKEYIRYQGTEETRPITKALVRLFQNKILTEEPEKSGLINFETRLKLRQISSNALTLLTLINFDESVIRECGHELLKLFPPLKLTRWAEVKTIKNFIVSRDKILGEQWLKDAFAICLEHNLFHQYDELLAAFTDSNDKIGKIFIESRQIFNHFAACFFLPCVECKRIHDDWPHKIYGICLPEFQAQIVELIINRLHQEFDADLYYHAVMKNIIEADQFYGQYIATIETPLENIPKSPLWMVGELVMPKLSEAINLSWHSALEIPAEVKAKFTGISDYYLWMLDPEEFDYARFNPLWVQAYKTTPVLGRVFKIGQVKESVKSYAEKYPDSLLASLYIRYAK